MRRPVLVLVLAVSAALVAPALAAPPGAGSATTRPVYGSDTHTCTSGATCDVQTSADSTGAASVTADYRRDLATSGDEYANGYGGQVLTVKVPPGTTRVTATFVWQVTGATATADAGAGYLVAYAGLAAFPSGCTDRCSSNPDTSQVIVTRSSDGAPSSTSGSGDPQVVTLHVTQTGALGRYVQWVSYAYAGTGATASSVCLTSTVCQTVSPTHLGSAHASLAATLTSSSVAFG